MVGDKDGTRSELTRKLLRLLIPVLYVNQEMVLRLGVVSGLLSVASSSDRPQSSQASKKHAQRICQVRLRGVQGILNLEASFSAATR